MKKCLSFFFYSKAVKQDHFYFRDVAYDLTFLDFCRAFLPLCLAFIQLAKSFRSMSASCINTSILSRG